MVWGRSEGNFIGRGSGVRGTLVSYGGMVAVRSRCSWWSVANCHILRRIWIEAVSEWLACLLVFYLISLCEANFSFRKIFTVAGAQI